MKTTDKAVHWAYIGKYWEELAATAWNAFTAHGRGALLALDIDAPVDDVTFIPLKMLERHPLLREYAEMARKYDPNREVVLVILTLPSSASAYRGSIAGRPSPPEAHAKLRAVLLGTL